MKKYLAEFATEELYSQFRNSNDFVTPNVSLITSINEFRFNKEEKTSFLINGEPYEGTGNIITLLPGGNYTLKGVWNGQIVIDATGSQPDNYTYIRLDGVTIISDKCYGILYDCPHSSNKGYKGLYVTLEKNTHNFVVCNNNDNTIENPETYASIDSWKDLTIQGVGYLAVYNDIAHGVRGENLAIAGPHIYADTVHDAIHGKNVNLYDGVFYVYNAKDGIGTTENGHINVFGGTYEFINLNEAEQGLPFDSKQPGYYVDESVFGEYAHNNITAISDAYEAGVVIGYNDEYPGGEVIQVTEITNKKWTANANNEPVLTDLETPLTTGYDLTGFESVTVTGKINNPLVFPESAKTPITNDAGEYEWNKKGELKTYDGTKLDITLSNAYIETTEDYPSIYYGVDVSRVKIIVPKETISVIKQNYTLLGGLGDHDAIKSENNLSIEVKNEGILYVTSRDGDGVDGGETRFTDSKGTFIVTNCGERGVKGNAIVIGPDAEINSSVIDSYITDPNAVDEDGKNIYTTFDGIFIAKGNVLNHTVGLVTYPDGMTDKDEKEAYAKTVGFADVFARNGKASKGMFGTTDTELKGVAIIGSLGAVIKIDEGDAKNLYVTNLLMDAVRQVANVEEQYKAVPYNDDPIV